MTQPTTRRLVTEDRFLVTEAEAAAAYDAVNSIASLSPNYIINGAFDFWQRGTSFSNPGTGVYTSDRWQVRRDGSGFTSSFYRFALSSNELNTTGLNYAAIYSVTSAGTSSTYNGIINKIEDVRTLENQTVTVSFWAKNVSGSSSITPIIQNWYGDGGSTQTFNSGTAISITSSWARYSQTITVTSTSGKTVGANSYNGLIFNFTPATTLQIAITGVQVEKGSVATDFRRNASSIQGELAACQRYYYRMTAGAAYGWFAFGVAYGTIAVQASTKFPVTMRTAPTAIDSSATSGFRLQGGQDEQTGITAFALSGAVATADNAAFDVNCSTVTAYRAYRLVANNSSSAYLGFSAEL